MKKLLVVVAVISVLIAGIGIIVSGGGLAGNDAEQTANRTMEASRVVYGSNATFVTSSEDKLLGQCESSNLSFAKLERNGRIIYWHHRVIDGAIVELDREVHIFDAETGELIESSVLNWREDLPQTLPPIITKEEAEDIAGGGSATLFFIDPNSTRFYGMEPTTNPCWVVWNSTEKAIGEYKYTFITITAVDATNREILGYGAPPPYEGYVCSGPYDDDPCTVGWPFHQINANFWLGEMGYSTQEMTYPNKTQIKSQIQGNDVAVFYVVSHGSYYYFLHGCTPEPIEERITNCPDVENWIANYPKMPFTFLLTCGAMDRPGPGSLEYAFRKGSDIGTAVVGGYHMADAPCKDLCGGLLDLYWQDEFFSKLSEGCTVQEAFNQANDKYLECEGCLRYTGDPNLKLVPKLSRCTAGLDIGAPAIDRLSADEGGYTYIQKENPADASGTINFVEIQAKEPLGKCKVGTFYLTGTNTLKCRSVAYIGDVPAGLPRTFSNLSLTVEAGDYIGIYFTGIYINGTFFTGWIDAGPGDGGIWWSNSDECWVAKDPSYPGVTYHFQGLHAISLYGTGCGNPPIVVGTVTGEIRDVNANLICDKVLTDIVVSLYEYGDGLCGSDVDCSEYSITVNATGDYWLLVANGYFRGMDTSNMVVIPPLHIDLTTPGKLAAGYVFDFEGDYGLVPRACNVSYALTSINHWLFPPSGHPEWGISDWKAMESVHSWLFPS